MSKVINREYINSELISTIFSKSGIILLGVFLLKPNLEMHQAEVIEKSKLSRMTVRNITRVFKKNHILKESKKGDLILYSIADNAVVKHLKILINISNIYESIKTLEGEGIEIFLFGSAARGEDTENSDIDLLIISDSGKDAILETIESVAKKLNREVNPLIYRSIEYSNLPDTDRRFYEKFEREKIRLL